MAKTVLVVDDNALIRQALCELFKLEADFEVCGDSSLSRIMPMFSTFQQPKSRQSCLKRQHKISLSEL